MSLALLNRNPVTWDSEAASYLTSVESEDSQSLEPAVSRAINQFVIDCKIRGIWSSIKASCLLCGPRTLSGALVPLKGIAPTNNNFISSDYTRKTGLLGNGSTKYLNSNRSNSADPTNSRHLSIYVTSPTTTINYPGYINAESYGLLIAGGGSLNNGFILRAQANHTINTSGSAIYNTTTGFIGVNRSSSMNWNWKINSIIGSGSDVSNSPGGVNYSIYTNNNGRFSFYTIGENIDLRLLEQCVRKYINIINILI